MFNTLHQFYNSKEWRYFREQVISERLSSDGFTIDEVTKQPIINAYDIILHHKIELTMANVNNYDISLNPDNIMIVSHATHNKIHKRFGRIIRKVYCVYGAPRAGKTTYVNTVKDSSDLVIDLDSIWQCIGDKNLSKPDELKQVMFKVRDSLYECVLMRIGTWSNAYIITTKPDIRLIDKLGAELIYIPADKNTCLSRCANDEWKEYVNAWFDNPPSIVKNIF